MGIGAVAIKWCAVCGTAHDGFDQCPGNLQATGAERPGWRVNVETPFGHESIGVLLAPSNDLWRARIMTLPGALWTLPGGRGTLKFVGGTREEAEARAIAFVEEHVRAKRYRRREGLASVAGIPLAGRASVPLIASSQRKAKCLPLRYGVDRATTRGNTFNVSADGMFIGTANPEVGGRPILVHLDLNGHTVPLRGLVMWSRRRAEPGRPQGMGIRLSEPPVLYQSYVSALG